MNPPHTNSKSPTADGSGFLFDAFGVSAGRRRAMGRRASDLYKNTYVHKKAGPPTFFAELAHRKPRAGGMLGMVLPLTATTGAAWQKFREKIASEYEDVVVFSVNRAAKTPFSHDTTMSEMILCARKSSGGSSSNTQRPSGRGVFVPLDAAPGSPLESAALGARIRGLSVRRLEDGPFGGTWVRGGSALDCPLEGIWGAAAGSDHVLQQVVWQLMQGGRLWLPRQQGIGIRPLKSLGSAGRWGLSHQQIRHPDGRASYTGPFRIRDWQAGAVYPALWNNHAQIQNMLVVLPDKTCEPGADETKTRIEHAWYKSASRVHINREFATASQALSMAFTEQPTIGGSSYQSIMNLPQDWKKPLVMWMNSTPGILLIWAVSNRQQAGKLGISAGRINDIMIPDFANMPAKTLRQAASEFDRLSGRKLLPAMRLNRDPVRQKLDESVLQMLGRAAADADLADLRERPSVEPSITGRIHRP